MPLINGVWRPVITLPIAATTADANLFGRAVLVFGWAFVETTGVAPVTFDIRDGNDASGALAAPISLLAGQSIRDITGPPGLFFQSGPFLDMIAGSVRGSLWYVDVLAAELADLDSVNV